MQYQQGLKEIVMVKFSALAKGNVKIECVVVEKSI